MRTAPLRSEPLVQERHNKERYDRVWELMEKISICMLTTHDGERIRSRPMAAFVRRDEDAIYFLGDAHHHKDEEIAENPNVGLAFADGQNLVSSASAARRSRATRRRSRTCGVRRESLVGTLRTIRTSVCSP